MGRACADRIARVGRRHGARRYRLRRHRAGGRRGLLQHRDDRLRGNPHRSVLCGPDHHLHVSPYRQCRHQRGGHRDREPRGGVVLHSAITQPSNYRATKHLDAWLKNRGVIGLAGIDTRALTALIREKGMPNAVIAHDPSGRFDVEALKREAKAWPGLLGMDLVPMVTSGQRFTWNETPWVWGEGYGQSGDAKYHVVSIDYGIKRNILRQLAGHACNVTVVPATTSADDILALKPDGIFLSNGPGDPAATGEYAVPVIRALIERKPVFGICLGHQMLGLAVGAKTMKMHQGHHGANHPVKALFTGKVEITSMNHGFAVDRATLPANAVETHVSLFDGSNCGIALKDRPVFSVQYHPAQQ